jgi:PmbA protein
VDQQFEGEPEWQELSNTLEVCRSVISLANREGAEAEIFVLKKDMKSIRVTSNEIVEAQDIVEEGAGIRVSKGGSIGFSATNTLERDQIEKAFRYALKMAKSSTKIPNWDGFPVRPQTSGESAALNTYDEALASSSPSQIVELSLEMLRQAARSSPKTCFLTSAVMALSEEFSILNSNGLEHIAEPSTTLCSFVMVEVKENTNYCTVTKQFSSRTLNQFNPEKVVEDTIHSARQMLSLPKKQISKSQCDVILSPQAAGAFTAYLIAPMIVGKSVQAGVSCFTNMLNSRVATEPFSLIDYGRMRSGIGSSVVDDEGSPTRSTKIIRNGVLNAFLYDTVTACLSGETSTGNARRASDTIGRTYVTPPEPLPTNLVIERGDYDYDELVEETKEGALVNSIGYAFPLVPERGYYNVDCNSSASIIENGEITGYTQNLTISGELSKTLTKIDGVGKEAQQSAYIGSIMTSSPHLKMKDVTVSCTKS